MGRQGSVCAPFHAGIQGAIDRLFESFVHVTLLVGSTDLGILFLSGDQKHTILVRVSTQVLDHVWPSEHNVHRIGPSTRHAGSTIDFFAPEGNEHDS